MSCCGTDIRDAKASLKATLSHEQMASRASLDLVLLVLAGFIAGNSTVATLVANVSEMSPQSRAHLQTGLLISTLIVAGLLAPQLGRSVAVNFRRRSLSVDALFILGCSGAMGYSLITYFRGTGSVYFEVFSILLVIYCIGSWVKRRTQQSVWTSLDAWEPTTHQCRVIERDGNLSNRVIADVQPGDRIRVPAGAMIPVDASVVDGRSFVRESTMTGEPHLRSVSQGDRVFASAVLVDACLDIEATERGDDRVIDRITSVVASAQDTPSRWQSQADSIARWFAPAVAAVAIATWACWAVFSDMTTAWMAVLSVLLVACPCAFGFATPVSIWVTISRMASRGLVVRRADVIERLDDITVIVFDKTGTLTVLQPELADFLTKSGNPFTREQILSAVQSIEAHSHHPIASVFLSDESKQDPTRNIELIPGVGVCGEVNLGVTWHRVEVGRLEELHRPCCDGQFLAQIRDAVGTGQQPIAIRIDDSLVAVGIVQETTIDTLSVGVAKLRELGVEMQLFSGDGGHRLERIGISDATGKMTPEAKLAGVRSLESSGNRVLFVGDGVNDAAAMTASTVAISVASGADLATESSDIVWHGQDLRAISDAITIARRSVSRLRRALLFAVTYNTIGMLIAASGWLHPVVAVLLMLGSSLTVVLHAADLNWESEEADPPPLLSSEPQRSSVNPPNDQRDDQSAVPSLVQIGSKVPVTP